MPVKPFISGLAGPGLSEQEATFFADTQPAGFILFARNIENPDQLSSLTEDLRTSVEREDLLILIDQEGGRVKRMGPPHWSVRPPMALFGYLYAGRPELASRALAVNMALIAADLRAGGLTGNCAPVLDVPVTGAHDIIGDRAFSTDPAIVAELGGVAATALLEAGILPVIKHIPGHGRPLVDSHQELPVVEAAQEALEQSDFAPFHALNHLPLAMTGHVVFSEIDAENCATFSPTLVSGIIRGSIGFGGLLMSDDISMGALEGPIEARALKALDAGLDLVLHCNGRLDEMKQVAAALDAMPEQRYVLLAEVLAEARERPMPDKAALNEEYNDLTGSQGEIGD